MQPALPRHEIVRRDALASTPEPLELLARSCRTAGGHVRYRLVEFIAARAGEGTTTVVRDFAASLGRATGASVLVVDASEPRRGSDRIGLMEAIVAGLPVERAATGTGNNVYEAKLSGTVRPKGELAHRVNDRDLWAAVNERFDIVVVDAPALARSNRGLVLAQHMDAVVVVVEAERTRAPVLNRLLDLLRRAEAPVIGTVLNKRRYHIPRFIYDRL